jgi:hypothetical protein
MQDGDRHKPAPRRGLGAREANRCPKSRGMLRHVRAWHRILTCFENPDHASHPPKKLLGHKDVKTTLIYTHVLNRGPLAVHTHSTRLLHAQPLLSRGRPRVGESDTIPRNLTLLARPRSRSLPSQLSRSLGFLVLYMASNKRSPRKVPKTRYTNHGIPSGYSTAR